MTISAYSQKCGNPLEYPTGGRDSFILALVVAVFILSIIILKKSKEEKKSFQELFLNWLGEKTLVQGTLMIITFIAFWLAVRAIGLNLWNFLINEDFNYTAYQALDIIAYVLVVNLCLTLSRLSVGKGAEIRRIVSATFQSVPIAVIIFLPRATANDTLEIFGQHGAAVFIIGFAALLGSLAYIWKLLPEEDKSKAVPPSPQG